MTESHVPHAPQNFMPSVFSKLQALQAAIDITRYVWGQRDASGSGAPAVCALRRAANRVPIHHAAVDGQGVRDGPTFEDVAYVICVTH